MATYTGLKSLHDYLSLIDIPDGLHSIDIDGTLININIINKIESYIYDGVEQFGNDIDDGPLTILNIKGDLTINEGQTLRPKKRCKGFAVFIQGILINHGEISMTALGAKGIGNNINLCEIDNVMQVIPAGGALGGAAIDSSFSGYGGKITYGNNGNNGNNRQSGGGGSSCTNIWTSSYARLIGAKGGNGTSYSGGTGAGGIVKHTSGSWTYTHPYNPEENGGVGGKGYALQSNVSGTNSRLSAGGGAGNNGGTGTYGASSGTMPTVPQPGQNGTGGLLILFVTEVRKMGRITSKGSNGGGASDAAGSGSGGGSINIFYTDPNSDLDYSGVNSDGGIGGWGSTDHSTGGKGSISIDFLNLDKYFIKYENKTYYRYNNQWFDIDLSMFTVEELRLLRSDSIQKISERIQASFAVQMKLEDVST
ncbi:MULTISPECIES: hypothetical protein [Lysinibacillus]|uniref:Uncharacterized protein n=1 Tax=Lysinibacillus fusiformis TaxID=28031 RepID=A0A1E4R7Z8_9BACI|nr:MULTISPECIES: hypothetical protein [Lysinibacillus]ODV56602.1 hypothetical protein BG258_12210 [Lysinibacillus fusiformis]